MDMAHLDEFVAERYGLALKPYSTDPIAAKELREHLSAVGFTWTLERGHGDPFVFAELWKGVHVYHVQQPTEELAIAACALKAAHFEIENLQLHATRPSGVGPTGGRAGEKITLGKAKTAADEIQLALDSGLAAKTGDVETLIVYLIESERVMRNVIDRVNRYAASFRMDDIEDARRELQQVLA
jgi:hypothetical protein